MTPAEVVFATVQVLVGIVLTAAIPWAFLIERRLARIEANVGTGLRNELSDVRKKVERDSDVIRDHESRLIKLEVRMVEHCEGSGGHGHGHGHSDK